MKSNSIQLSYCRKLTLGYNTNGLSAGLGAVGALACLNSLLVNKLVVVDIGTGVLKDKIKYVNKMIFNGL